MAQKEQVTKLREISKKCTETPIENLVSNPDWGKLNFKQSQADLETAFSIFNDLLILPIDILPDGEIQNIIDHAEPIKDTIDSIKFFDIEESGETRQRRDSLTNELRGRIGALYVSVQSRIPYLAYKKGDIQKNLNQLTTAISDTNQFAEDTKRELQRKKTEIDEIIVAAREASASAGVAHFSSDFSREAKDGEESAKSWLIAAGLFGFISLGTAFAFFFTPSKAETGYMTIQLITTRLIILGVLISATLWCGRIYKALKHQVTVNKHRANAIKTFQAFSKAASDDATRDAVLMETTRSIFGQSSTGYLDGEKPSSNDQFKMIEVVKPASKKIQPDTAKADRIAD